MNNKKEETQQCVDAGCTSRPMEFKDALQNRIDFHYKKAGELITLRDILPTKLSSEQEYSLMDLFTNIQL